MSNLVIVESPAKATTIKNYLGSNYKVLASKGHIRDLPKSSLGVDVEHDFEPHYINIRGKADVINKLKSEAKKASKIFLATDPDREGEAISWHLANTLGIPLDTACRISFNEITKDAIKDAVKHPRAIDLDLVNSQQARRILDRIVGYQLSPFLWKNVKSGLSAGRVQSVATRIICEREEEIRAFVPQEYWTIEALLAKEGGALIRARYAGKEMPTNEEEARAIERAVTGGTFAVKSVKATQKNRQPAPPFTTSTMQQEASKKYGFQSQRIMKIAQELYEGINLGPDLGGVQGLITYMRTDSLRVAESAQNLAREYVREKYGDAFCPSVPNTYKSKSNAQDAHEAIRPAMLTLTPDMISSRLSEDQNKLYRLIWERFVASQMTPAVYDTVSVDSECAGYRFRTSGSTVKFSGYTVVYDNHESEALDGQENIDAGKLPPVKVGEKLATNEITSRQHFTEPAPRYTDASLIKILEESGIGRPSTFATIITTIITREYVKRVGKTLVPTPLGEITTKLMKESFSDIVDYEFTAQLEDKLDSIEHGGTTMMELLSSFYAGFDVNLKKAMESVTREEVPAEESEVLCEKCGSKMIYKNGRFGKFLACPNYPECRNTKAIDKSGNLREKKKIDEEKIADFKCELCGSDVVMRRGPYGDFYACTNYPTCSYTKQILVDTGVPCPKCGSRIVVRHSKSKRVFYGCESFPSCDFSTWEMPLVEKCPLCESLLTYNKTHKSISCINDDCPYTRQEDMQVIE